MFIDMPIQCRGVVEIVCPHGAEQMQLLAVVHVVILPSRSVVGSTLGCHAGVTYLQSRMCHAKSHHEWSLSA